MKVSREKGVFITVSLLSEARGNSEFTPQLQQLMSFHTFVAKVCKRIERTEWKPTYVNGFQLRGHDCHSRKDELSHEGIAFVGNNFRVTKFCCRFVRVSSHHTFIPYRCIHCHVTDYKAALVDSRVKANGLAVGMLLFHISVGLSPRANYTDRASAACQRSANFCG
jgi:hypothetical protein